MSAGKLRVVCIGRNRRLLSGASSFEDVPDKIGPLVRFGVPNDISWGTFQNKADAGEYVRINFFYMTIVPFVNYFKTSINGAC